MSDAAKYVRERRVSAADWRLWTLPPLERPCVEFLGPRTTGGYGYVYVRELKKKVPAHRLAWEQGHGPIPKGMLVCHHCDNPPCVELTHLFLGTYRDNNHDMWAKGRGYQPTSPFAGLTHCKRGHELVESNIYRSQYRPNERVCRRCALDRQKTYRPKIRRQQNRRRAAQRAAGIKRTA